MPIRPNQQGKMKKVLRVVTIGESRVVMGRYGKIRKREDRVKLTEHRALDKVALAVSVVLFIARKVKFED